MPVSQFHTLDSIQIPRGMVWEDEMAWRGVETSTDRGINGALIVDVFVRTAGRPITLVGTESAGWLGMPRSTVLALMALADAAAAVEPMPTHTFTHADGRVFEVIFAPGEDAIVARPLARPELPPADYPYVATVRLVTVS